MITSFTSAYLVVGVVILPGEIYNWKRILAKRTIETMTSGQLKLGMFGEDNFGLGFAITSDISAARIQGTPVLLNGVATL